MGTDDENPLRRPGAASEDDLPPTGRTANAERRDSVAPIFWTILGVVVIAAFVMALVFMHGVSPSPSIGK
jgi:hypothetical protein